MRNAIVFGASSGIGKELAKMLCDDGFYVVATGRRKNLLDSLKASAPDTIQVWHNDVRDIETLTKGWYSLIKELGSVDLVVLSSGIGYINPKLEWDKAQDVINTNIIGATKIYNLVFELFNKQKFGHLIGLASVAGLRGNRFAPSYYASKAYQINYLESLYLKCKEIDGGEVYVTDVRPGFVDTRMALGDGIFWMSSVEKASKQIYSAIKRKKRLVYISRRWNLIAWVLKIAPSWLMKKVM